MAHVQVISIKRKVGYTNGVCAVTNNQLLAFSIINKQHMT